MGTNSVTFRDTMGDVERVRTAEILSGAEYYYGHMDWKKNLTMSLRVGEFTSVKEITIHNIKGVCGQRAGLAMRWAAVCFARDLL